MELETPEVQNLAVLDVFKNVSGMNKTELRDFIHDVEKRLLQETGENVTEIPVTHHFSKDVYAREIKIPAGTLLVGKIHKHQNLNILSQGEMTVLSVDGLVRVKAPYTVVSTPGVKRLAYAHTDCVWTTIHGTDETDVEKIEEKFIAKTYEEVVGDPLIIDIKQEEKPCLGL